MNHGISIRPSKDIRTNYAQTVNGKEDTVLLSHEEYQSIPHQRKNIHDEAQAMTTSGCSPDAVFDEFRGAGGSSGSTQV